MHSRSIQSGLDLVYLAFISFAERPYEQLELRYD